MASAIEKIVNIFITAWLVWIAVLAIIVLCIGYGAWRLLESFNNPLNHRFGSFDEKEK
jgi:hypothetical protein